MTRNALGRGLGALIREPEPQQQAVQAPQPAPVTPMGSYQVDIDLIDPNPYQPRTHFREEALEELARSIQANGIIQPLVLRKMGVRYQLIAGERRWRAAQRAGLQRVPVVLRDVPEEQALELTLVENLQREDLNPIEEARAFDKLLNEFHLTQEEVAGRTGKDRTTIANSVRLLRLDKPILDLMEDGKVSAGHARSLLAVTDGELRNKLAHRIARGGLTVRQLERFVVRKARPGQSPVKRVDELDPNMRAAIEELERHLGTKVTMRIGDKSRNRPGQLIIDFYSDEQASQIYEKLMT
jgi:ParB family chromosome partitioning protein